MLSVRSCLIHGEAVVCNEKRPAVFDLIRGYRHDAVLCAFHLLELDGEDLRRTPIEERKRILAKLLSHPHEGIAFNGHYTGDGAIIFKHARAHGLRGRRVEAPPVGLPLRSRRLLAQDQELSRARGQARGRGRLEPETEWTMTGVTSRRPGPSTIRT